MVVPMATPAAERTVTRPQPSDRVAITAGGAAESDGLAAHLHRAGSDDSTADFAAGSASSAGARANRDAYAELAQADPAESAEAEGKWLRPPGAASRTVSLGNEANAVNIVNRNAELSTSRAIERQR